LARSQAPAPSFPRKIVGSIPSGFSGLGIPRQHASQWWYSQYQWIEFCGDRIQGFSFGQTTRRDGTPTAWSMPPSPSLEQAQFLQGQEHAGAEGLQHGQAGSDGGGVNAKPPNFHSKLSLDRCGSKRKIGPDFQIRSCQYSWEISRLDGCATNNRRTQRYETSTRSGLFVRQHLPRLRSDLHRHDHR